MSSLELKHVKFDEICLLVTDGTHDSPKLQTHGVPFIKGKHISSGNINFEICDYISESDHKLCIKRVLPQRNDVLLSNIGSVGDCAQVKTDEEFSIKNVALLRPNSSEVDAKYFFYLFKNPKFKADLLNLRAGSAQQFISLAALRSFEFQVIKSLRAQSKVGSLLAAYDDLIENNRRRIALLEDAARLLYREWFVHFRFPGHEHVKIVDGVPEGWVEGKVSDLGLAITGKTPSKKVEANFGEEVPFIKTPDMHGNVFVISTEESLSEQGAKTQSNKTLPIGSIMVSCIGTVGAVAMNASPAQTNQQINTVILKYPHWQFFAFFALKAIKPRLEAMGGGATMANVNKTKFKSVPVLLPSDELILSFHEIVKPQFELIEKLARQNVELVKARDLLLPRLMDGRLEV